MEVVAHETDHFLVVLAPRPDALFPLGELLGAHLCPVIICMNKCIMRDTKSTLSGLLRYSCLSSVCSSCKEYALLC